MRKGAGVDLENIKHTDPRLPLFNNLNADAARFAKFREAQKARELAETKTDLDKQRVEKKYREFLLTEKQTIFAQSAAAERWTGFAENADLYPNLEYRTAGDADVRPEHARLDGIILPINDPFWRGHTPPLGFGCRCELVQTDEQVNKNQEKYKGFENTPVPKGFNFNPGVDQKLFSDDAGYYTSAPAAEAKQLTTTAETFYAEFTKGYGKKLIGKSLSTGSGKMKVTEEGIKQAVNEAHRDFTLKNTLLENLPGLVKGLKFKAVAGKDDLFYAAFKLNGKQSYVIAERTADELVFKSITDTLNF